MNTRPASTSSVDQMLHRPTFDSTVNMLAWLGVTANLSYAVLNMLYVVIGANERQQSVKVCVSMFEL